MRQSKQFKSYKEAKEYIESLSLEEHIQFCEDRNNNYPLFETDGPVLSFDDEVIPIFPGSYEDMIKKYNGLTPDGLMELATGRMKQKLIEMEREENNKNSQTVNESSEEQIYPSSDEVFDLDKIPMDVLDKGWQSYRPYLDKMKETVPNRDRLPEAASTIKNIIKKILDEMDCK